MRVFYMTEQPLYSAWSKSTSELSVTLPNRHCDPLQAADAYDRFYREYQLADELGLDIMINEHHGTASCLSASAAIPLAILARATRKARLLVLGYPIGLRPDPLRAAEELAMIDVISRGRLEMGFVKGVPWEIPVSNINALELSGRYWEGLDFVTRAMTSHDAPFSWEGKYFHYRNVNLWPRPYQQPLPPIWMTTSNAANAAEAGARGYTLATLGNGYKAKGIFDAYRQQWQAAGRAGTPGLDRFAYLALVAVAPTEAQARAKAEIMLEFTRSLKGAAPQFRNPPGFMSATDAARAMTSARGRPSFGKDGRPIFIIGASVQDLIDAGMMFCGTPEQVSNQILEFSDAVGGFGNLLMMAQAAGLSHEDTVEILTLFAEEVYPTLRRTSPMATAAVPLVEA